MYMSLFQLMLSLMQEIYEKAKEGGDVPVYNSANTQPKLHMSMRGVYRIPSITSGAR